MAETWEQLFARIDVVAGMLKASAEAREAARRRKCQACHGTGILIAGDSLLKCNLCGGSGKTQEQE